MARREKKEGEEGKSPVPLSEIHGIGLEIQEDGDCTGCGGELKTVTVARSSFSTEFFSDEVAGEYASLELCAPCLRTLADDVDAWVAPEPRVVELPPEDESDENDVIESEDDDDEGAET